MSDSQKQPLADPATLSYEEAKEQLRLTVAQLESGSIPLEDTLAIWTRGQALAARCRHILEEAAAKLEEAQSVDREQPEGTNQ